jgi:hypothetical protein
VRAEGGEDGEEGGERDARGEGAECGVEGEERERGRQVPDEEAQDVTRRRGGGAGGGGEEEAGGDRVADEEATAEEERVGSEDVSMSADAVAQVAVEVVGGGGRHQGRRRSSGAMWFRPKRLEFPVTGKWARVAGSIEVPLWKFLWCQYSNKVHCIIIVQQEAQPGCD